MMYTITKKQIKSHESVYGNERETITVKELLELVVDLLNGKVATTEIMQEYQYFLTLKDGEDIMTGEFTDECKRCRDHVDKATEDLLKARSKE